jgi:anti-sigma regulatory factor (Ser/Thr protein kinase)
LADTTTMNGVASEMLLPAQPSGLRLARAYAHEAGSAFGLDPDACYDFALAANEAVTNAIRHGAPDAHGHIHLSVAADAERLMFSVRDHGKFSPRIRQPATIHDGGRGMAIMASLMDEVQICLTPQSTTVLLYKARSSPSSVAET